MTPDLQELGGRRLTEHVQRGTQEQTASGGRSSGFARIAQAGQLDTTHGAILYLEDVSVSFDGFKAINKLSLDIAAGELRCIIGPNGAGKTTMMDIITGKTRPDEGSVFFGSTIDLLRYREADIAQMGIGRKFQKPTVFEQLSVFENLELALKTHKGVASSMFFRLDSAQSDRLLGRNGVGKTTLLKSLMGLIPIRSGSIGFNGVDITQATPYERSRAGIGYVPQGREIFARLSVEGNLRMGLAYKSAREPIPAELFELFPVLKQMLSRRGGDLSGGQQQQLAIARALAAKPKLLILDEPTEGIQPSIIKDIGRVIRTLADRGDMAILLVEQYYDFAEELADDYLVMERGQFIAQGLGSQMQENGVRQLVAI